MLPRALLVAVLVGCLVASAGAASAAALDDDGATVAAPQSVGDVAPQAVNPPASGDGGLVVGSVSTLVEETAETMEGVTSRVDLGESDDESSDDSDESTEDEDQSASDADRRADDGGSESGLEEGDDGETIDNEASDENNSLETLVGVEIDLASIDDLDGGVHLVSLERDGDLDLGDGPSESDAGVLDAGSRSDDMTFVEIATLLDPDGSVTPVGDLSLLDASVDAIEILLEIAGVELTSPGGAFEAPAGGVELEANADRAELPADSKADDRLEPAGGSADSVAAGDSSDDRTLPGSGVPGEELTAAALLVLFVGGLGGTPVPVTRETVTIPVSSRPPAGRIRSVALVIGESIRRLLPYAAVVVGASRRESADPLDNETRRTIYELVSESPGTYYARLASETDVTEETIRYHSRILVDEGLLTSRLLHGRRRLYPVTLEEDDPELAAVMVDSAPSNVLAAIERNEPTTLSQIADTVECAPSTVAYHLDRLEEDGLITRTREGSTVTIGLRVSTRSALQGSVADD